MHTPGPDWRGTPTDGDRPARRRVLIGLAALGVLVGLFLAVLSFARRPEPPMLFAFGVSTSAEPGREDAEVSALASWPGFGSVANSFNASRDQLRTDLRQLARAPRSRPLVVYWAGAVDAEPGGAFVPARVPGGDHAGNRVPFDEVLDALRACPCEPQLLVLSPTGADWVSAALAALNRVPDARRRVLFAHGPGEASHARTAGGSAFSCCVFQGLSGAADGWNGDAARDGRVSTDELAAFVRARVSRWAGTNSTIAQTPFLAGDGADFLLGTASDWQPPASEPAARPQELADAWAAADGWKERDTEFRKLTAALRKAETNWTSARSFAAIQKEATRLRDRFAAGPGSAVPLYLQPLPPSDPAATELLVRYTNRLVAQPTSQEKPPPFTREVVLAAATEPTATRAHLQLLVKLLAEREPLPMTEADLLLRRAVTDESVPVAVVQALLRAAGEWQAAHADAEFHSWARPVLDELSAEWVSAVALSLAPGWADASDATAVRMRFAERLRSLSGARTAFRQARAVAAGAAELSEWSSSFDQGFAGETRDLLAALQPPAGGADLARLTATAANWATRVEAIERRAAELRPEFDPPALAKLAARCRASDAGPAELEAVWRVLASPLPRAPDRSTLWVAALELETKLDQRAARRDTDDDEQFTAGTFRPTFVDPRVPPEFVRRAAPARVAIEPLPAASQADWLAWHARRFEYLRQNPWGHSDARAEVDWAARAMSALGQPVPVVPKLEIQANPVALTPREPSARAAVSVRLAPADGTAAVRCAAFTPSPDALRATVEAATEFPGIREQSVPVAVSAGAHPERVAVANGFLFRAEVAGRPYFHRAAVDLGSLSNRLELLLKTDDAPTPAARGLRVRPNGQPVSAALLLRNPTATAQTVIVKLLDPPRESAAVTLPPGQTQPVVFAPPPVAVPPAPADEFVPVPESLRVQLLDAKSLAVRQEFAVPLALRMPTELLAVREATFKPGSPNELNVKLVERESVRGAAVPVVLTFPDVATGALVVAGGRLSGAFEPGGAAVALNATGLAATEGSLKILAFHLNIDGVERAYRFRGNAGRDGETVRFEPRADPAVQLDVAAVATGLGPLPVKVDADGGSDRATVEVSIGTRDSEAFAPELTLKPIPAKTRDVRVKFDPKGGMVVRASISDPAVSLAVERFVGVKWVRARLLDEDGRALAADFRRVVFDPTPPQKVRFVNPPAEARKDKPVPLVAACDLPASGIKEVRFFVGEPVKDAPPPGAVPVMGKAVPGKPNEWTAAVALGDGTGAVAVSVQIVSNAGFARFATTSIERIDPAEADKPKPATLTGVVVEGAIPQPGLTVQLFDEKGAEKAKATTDANGKFKFDPVPAGKYQAFAAKPATNRERRLPVELEAGKTRDVRLELLLK